MLISEETINKIRSSNDIVDIIGSYISLTPKGKNFFGVCPFHEDHSPSLSVNKDKQIFKCFSCGVSGNVITFVKDYEHITYVEAIRLLGKKVGIDINIEHTPKIDASLKEYYEAFRLSTMLYKNNLNSSLGLKAKKYLSDRQVTEDIIDKFQIGLSSDEPIHPLLLKKYDKNLLMDLDLIRQTNNVIYDVFKNRIMFPIKDINGNIVGYSARIYNTDIKDSKYINTSETKIFKKGQTLFNFSDALSEIKHKKEIIICEGQMDAIRLVTININNVVSLMGTSFTKEQFNIIKNLNVKVVLNLDQDNAGRDATYTIGTLLEENNIDVSVILFDSAKDSDELISKNGKETFEKAYKHKVSFLDYKLDYIKKNYDLNDSIGLSKYINEIIKNLNTINDDVLRELKIKDIVKIYGINENIIRSKLSKKTKEVLVKEDKKIQNKFNKYDVSEIRIIYLMLMHEEVIRIYEKGLGYLISNEMSNFVNSILSFKNKYKHFEYADFICYIEGNNELKNTLNKIIGFPQKDEYTEEELEDYFNVIKQYNVESQIKKLEKKLKESLDLEEKKKISNQILNIKKEVLKW